jgi:hypothetical protein
MSLYSSHTSMPKRSHASSASGDGGLWAVRIALNPAALRTSISRSSLRANATAPIGPWLLWMQAPRTFVAVPLSRKPSVPFHSNDRIPKVVVVESTSLPSTRTSVRAWYRVGDSGDHSAAFQTGMSTV